ncbi:hypothetical protein PR202_gb21650 [Eleusine coracana subsp. coracana]|uniref:Uncharacterized protein n=1 Tax=Eleusine coracana subsp. coracana TaxID=191504 RepID=A0AAV5FDQ1_ELECO|nr:hypothetical protein PR202_gb21650 [Eleusine coracana subsp. coracana]
MDLSHIFYLGATTPPNGSAIPRPPASKIEMAKLPRPCFNFRASASSLNDEWKMDCFPLADCKVICADQSGGGFLFDANTRQVGTLPLLHKPKVMPISLFVPKADVDDDFYHEGCGSSLFLMEGMLKPESSCSMQENHQFEAFIYRKTNFCGLKSWHCLLLPPPPFIYEARNWDNNRPQITSYAVVGGEICISVDGIGTYCLDTTNHSWREVGKWTLPFYGKLEYVPELKLWFGLSAESQALAAADLSTMDSQPQLLGPWKELDPPEEWKECKDSQFVNVGSSMFCIARFFQTTKTTDVNFGDESMDKNFAVLTGVEVMPCVHDANGNTSSSDYGKVTLKMNSHILRRGNCTTIESLF